MAFRQKSLMDIDIDAVCNLPPLKRYNSAPYINSTVGETNTNSDIMTQTIDTVARSSASLTPVSVRIPDKVTRRFSTSSVTHHSPSSLGKMPSRLDQIRLEETVAQHDQEAAHEREIQSRMMMSQSCEDLSLDDAERMATDAKRPRWFAEPLHVFTTNYQGNGSLSPTRVGKQCFSPSLQQPIKNSAFTPSPSPSPTRKTVCARRSLSPIVLRPSPLSGIKRRADSESVDVPVSENYFSTPKRFRSNGSPSASLSFNPEVQCQLLERRISTSSVSGSSADDVGSCDDRDAIGLEFPASGFGPHSHCSPTATTSVVSSSLPSPSYAFRCISSSDSVEPRPASESTAAANARDDVEPVAELPSGASSRSSVL